MSAKTSKRQTRSSKSSATHGSGAMQSGSPTNERLYARLNVFSLIAPHFGSSAEKAADVAISVVDKLLGSEPKSIATAKISTASPVARFTKVSAAGTLLPDSAKEWEGVYDSTTGLIWGRRVLPGEANWKDSVKKAEASTLCGAPARAPTVTERFGIVDFSRVDPALDTKFFDAEGYIWEWTSTASPSDCAWSVYLGDGYSDRYGQSNRYHVRAVRAGQF